MNNAKSLSGFSKIRRLVTVLEKCNGKETVGGKDALISPKAVKLLIGFFLLLLVGALFAVFYFTEPLIAAFLPVAGITQAIMLIVMMISFVLSVKNIVNVLYTADDLPVLLPMPFSAGQIVSAKLAVASKFAVGLSLILINSICLGLGVRAGMGAPYVIGTLLSSLLTPLTGIALATLVVVVVFRVFGFIRNRDITVVLGGIFTLLLTGSYIFINGKFNSNGSESAAAFFAVFASVSAGFPNISFMSRFMFDGDLVGLLVSVGITAAVTALAMLAVKLFYIPTALSMQTTGTARKAVSRDSLGSRKVSALKALTSYESKHTRRNPAYFVYGFAMSLIWPAMMFLPTLLGNNSFLADLKAPMDARAAVISALLLGITASCFSCGFNILATSAFSREGHTYEAIRALPIDFKDYYRSKRNFAMLICSIGSVLYILILGVVCVATGFLTLESCWVALYGAGISFLLNLMLVNLMLLHNARKPYFNWDSETEISRKLSWVNIVTIVVGVFTLILFFVSLVFSGSLSAPEHLNDSGTVTMIISVTAIVLTVIILVATVWINRFSVRKAEQYLDQYE
ncbi:hypothetical protein [Ruminococcus sp.]|uniref:hypothetical protein n=1 Tax=Ruminococcus sp. TaxID=41978 RepID=UPI00388FCB4A